MKIAVASDLHLEFGDLDFENTDGAEVLILSGDILLANDLNQHDPLNIFKGSRSNQFHSFMSRCSERFPHVIFVAGNHEHYHGDFATTVPKLKEVFAYLSNVHVLEKESITVGDVTFLGGTLWTDMNRKDPHTMYAIRGYMNDFRCIKNSRVPVSFRDSAGNHHQRVGRFSPEDSVDEHLAMLEFIDASVKANPAGKFVVAGHHAPSKLSIKPRYAGDTMVNGAYSSDLSEFMLDHPQIRLWTHGHTHDVFDYMIGTCRIVCNPRGYDGHEERANQWELLTIEL